MSIYGQGDILIARTDKIPDLPEVEGRRVLAYGEVTGHAHVLEGDATLFRAEDVQELEKAFIRVVRVVDDNGELIRKLTLDPSRQYQPSQPP